MILFRIFITIMSRPFYAFGYFIGLIQLTFEFSVYFLLLKFLPFIITLSMLIAFPLTIYKSSEELIEGFGFVGSDINDMQLAITIVCVFIGSYLANLLQKKLQNLDSDQ